MSVRFGTRSANFSLSTRSRDPYNPHELPEWRNARHPLLLMMLRSRMLPPSHHRKSVSRPNRGNGVRENPEHRIRETLAPTLKVVKRGGLFLNLKLIFPRKMLNERKRAPESL